LTETKTNLDLKIILKVGYCLSKYVVWYLKVIQSCLADRTVLTIAHRVDTVLGSDRLDSYSTIGSDRLIK